jgi:hypothetical protein
MEIEWVTWVHLLNKHGKKISHQNQLINKETQNSFGEIWCFCALVAKNPISPEITINHNNSPSISINLHQSPKQSVRLAAGKPLHPENKQPAKTTAAVEGGIIGARGILMGFADFPVLIGIKLKLLLDLKIDVEKVS